MNDELVKLQFETIKAQAELIGCLWQAIKGKKQ